MWPIACRQADDETPAVGSVGLIARLTTIDLGQSPHDRQTKACTLLSPCARGVGPGELAEEPGPELIVLREAIDRCLEAGGGENA